MGKWYEIVWPILETNDGVERANDQRLRDELEAIERACWGNVEPVLQEARRLAALEDDRRKSAEQKASIYLAALAAIVPLTGTLVNAFSGPQDTFSQWRVAVFLVLLCIVAAYLVAVGIWSFRTIKRDIHHRPDVKDLLAAQESATAKTMLCKAILRCVAYNGSRTNTKVTFMAMAHEFLVRLFVLYVLLLVFVGLTSLSPSAQTPPSLGKQSAPPEKALGGGEYPQRETHQAYQAPLSELDDVDIPRRNRFDTGQPLRGGLKPDRGASNEEKLTGGNPDP